PADHLLRQILLDLLGLELAHEALQQLARLLIARALNADRRQQITVVLRDREVHADMARDEVFELLAQRADQRRVRAEVVLRSQAFVAAAVARAHRSLISRAPHHSLAQRCRARRQVDAREQTIHPIDYPSLERHVVNSGKRSPSWQAVLARRDAARAARPAIRIRATADRR